MTILIAFVPIKDHPCPFVLVPSNETPTSSTKIKERDILNNY